MFAEDQDAMALVVEVEGIVGFDTDLVVRNGQLLDDLRLGIDATDVLN